MRHMDHVTCVRNERDMVRLPQGRVTGGSDYFHRAQNREVTQLLCWDFRAQTSH